MTVHVTEQIFQVTAAEDLSTAAMRYKAVTIAGTIAGNVKNVAGLLKFGANSGGFAGVIIAGITKADCAIAISTPGWGLKATTSGWLTAAASGDQIVGRYMGQTATASGDRIPIWLDAMGVGFWTGQ